MKLIVGLGNPGKEYEETRHNLGFKVIDRLVKTLNLSKRTKFNGEYYEYMSVKKEKVILLKPLSYMNLSGSVIKRYIDFFKIDVKNIIILFDDMDMKTGKIRIREQGRSGGHNGIKDIISSLKTETFKRIKIGILDDSMLGLDGKDYVLSKFSSPEKKAVEDSIKKVTKICVDYINNDDSKLIVNNYSDNKLD